MGEHDSGTVVLRADLGAYKRWFGQPILGFGFIVAFVGLSIGRAVRGGDGWLVGLILLVTVVASLAGVAIQIATSRVTIGDGRVEYRRWLRRTTLRLDDDLVGAVGVLVDASVGRTSYRLVVRARSGGPRIWLNGAYWDHDDLLRVAEVTGARVTDAELTPREFNQLAPGTMPWRTLHPWWFGGGAAVLLTAVIAAGVFVWFDVKNLPPYDEQPPKAVAAATVREQDAVVADLQDAVGGQWAPGDPRLSTCNGLENYKGWERHVTAKVARSISDSGEDVVVTPVLPTRAVIDQVREVLEARGFDQVSGDLDEAVDGYVEVRAYSTGDGQDNDVSLTFSGDGYASIDVYGDCEVPGR